MNLKLWQGVFLLVLLSIIWLNPGWDRCRRAVLTYLVGMWPIILVGVLWN